MTPCAAYFADELLRRLAELRLTAAVIAHEDDVLEAGLDQLLGDLLVDRLEQFRA